MSRFIPNRTPCGRTRREFLWQVGAGFAGVALTDMLASDALAAALRNGDPAILGRIEDGRVLLDPRTLTDAEVGLAAEAVASVVAAIA